MDSESSNKVNANDQNTILDAYLTDDLHKLQVLLEDVEQLPSRDDPDIRWNSREYDLPAIQELLIKAATSKQAKVVKFLLQRYPTLVLNQQFQLVQAVLDNPDADTLQALCDHDKNFASFSIDYHYQCFITEACLRPLDEIVPVLHVLLDNGANVNDGLGPGGGALCAALLGSQPEDIIGKIVQKGGMVSFRVLSSAIEKERLDVLEMLLRGSGNNFKWEDLIGYARNTGNEKLIAVVGKFVRGRERKRRKFEKKSEMKRWWQVWKLEA